MKQESPRIASGKTWDEYEGDLRIRFSDLNCEALERLVRIHRRIFDRHSAPHPISDEREQSFKTAYEMVWPSMKDC